jgi:hypothetical protein
MTHIMSTMEIMVVAMMGGLRMRVDMVGIEPRSSVRDLPLGAGRATRLNAWPAIRDGGHRALCLPQGWGNGRRPEGESKSRL